MQENRSFDSYFGTFPGADGIPMSDGVPTVCVPDPRGRRRASGRITIPHDRNRGGPHNARAAVADIDGGRMDGFIAAARARAPRCAAIRTRPTARGTRRRHGLSRRARASQLLEIRARFRAAGPSLRAERVVELTAASLHGLGMVGVVRAHRRSDELRQRAAVSRLSARLRSAQPRASTGPGRPDYAWTDLTYLLHAHHVSWAYYVMAGTEPDCANNLDDCAAGAAERATRRAYGTCCRTSIP